jgi:serine/threonine protein kinase
MSDPAAPFSDDPLHGNSPSDLLRAALGAGTSPAPSFRPQWDPPAPEELALLMPQYSITRLIGRGGMGAVYQGVQLSLSRDVAIKLLPPELGAEPEFEARFKREAMALARLNHPNIVQIHDYGQTLGGHHYIVMEYVDGTDLHQLIRSGSLDVTSALNAVGQICGALDYAHGEGFVHRDVKPANIFINRKGVLKIGDFGLAKLMGAGAPGGNDADHLTRSDVVMGTLHYIAPEQLGGNDVIDHRADIFSLGVMFYEMLTGTVPRGAFRPPSDRVQALDVRIDGVIFKAMEEDPEDRYQSAADLASDVERIRTGSPDDSGAEPSPGRKRPSTPPGSRWRFLTGGLAGMAAVATLLFFAIRHPGGFTEPTVSTESERPWIPLLPHVDPARDAVKGVWEWDGQEIQGSNPEREPGPSLLMLPYDPPEEYDFRISFTTHQGNCEASQILHAFGKQFCWATATGADEKLAAFDRVGGMTPFQRARSSRADQIPAAVKLAHRPFAGVKHESIVEVRRDRVTAFVNGEKLVDWPTDYQEMSIEPQFSLPRPTALGVGIWLSETTFHDISVREVSGMGKWVRHRDATSDSLAESQPEVPEPPVPSAASRSIIPLRTALAECRDRDRTWRESVGGTDLPAFEIFFVREQDPRSLGASFMGLETLAKKERWTAFDQSAARSFAFQFAKSAQDLTDNLDLLENRSRTGNAGKDREFTLELVGSGLTERIKEAVNEVAVEVSFVDADTAQSIVPPMPASISPSTESPEVPENATKATPFRNSLGMKFVPVPGTKVLFCIHETRYRDYEAFARDNPYLNQRWKAQTEEGFVITERSGDHPVTWVIWSEAKAFCDWLGKKEGRSYRLPTDEEWMVAAGMIRHAPGGTAVNGIRYPWGNQWPPPPGAGNYSDQSRKARARASTNATYLEHYDDGFPTTAPVMSFPPNEFGLHDLGGNVWEWVEDPAPDNPAARLRRGGSWRLASESDLRSSYRLSNEPDARDPIHGFRLVVSPTKAEPMSPR